MTVNSQRLLLAAAGAGDAAESYWIAELSDSSASNFEGGAIDDAGNVYAIGFSRPGGGDYDYQIAKYDTDGQIQWQRSIGSTSNDFGKAGAIDSSGNFYATGEAPNEILTVKYNSTGGVVWQKEFDTGGTYSRVSGATTDSSDNFYMCGYNSRDGVDIELIKVNSSGTNQWTRELGDADFDFGYNVAVDSSGNVYISGYKEDSDSNRDALIAKYNSSGTLQWQRELGGSGDDRGFAIGVDSAGNAYLVGQDESTGTGSAGFIAKYNSSGTLQWQRRLDSSSNEIFRAVAFDADDNVYAAGKTSQSGTDSWLIVKYNSSGTLQWQRELSCGGSAQAYAIAGIKGDSIYIVGDYNHTLSSGLIVKLPTDGSLTGTYVGSNATFVYSSVSLTDSANSLTDSAASLTSTARSLNVTTTTYTNTTSTLTSATTAVE